MKRIFAIIFVMVLFLSGCVHTPDPTGTVPTLVKPEIAPPKLVQVTRGEFRDYYAYHATVAPYSQGLFFDISGVIGNAYVYAGKAVKKGELLAELDHSALSARIVSLETDIADTETVAGYTDRMAKLQIDILKVELLQLEDQLAAAEETAVSRIRQQIALKKNEIAQAEADLRQEQALREARLAPKLKELEQLRKEKQLYFLYAPFDGVIAYDVQLHPGFPVSPAEPVIILSDDSRMVLDISGRILSDSMVNAYSVVARIGDTDFAIEWIPPTEQELFYAAQNDTAPNALYEILGTEEELAKLEFGQYASVGVTYTFEENVLLLPVGAVQENEAGQLWVEMDENGQRVKRSVEVGGHNTHCVWITGGLEEGAYVYVPEK